MVLTIEEHASAKDTIPSKANLLTSRRDQQALLASPAAFLFLNPLAFMFGLSPLVRITVASQYSTGVAATGYPQTGLMGLQMGRVLPYCFAGKAVGSL